MTKQQRSERLRPHLLGLAVGQVVMGGALTATCLVNDDLALPAIGALVASWCLSLEVAGSPPTPAQPAPWRYASMLG